MGFLLCCFWLFNFKEVSNEYGNSKLDLAASRTVLIRVKAVNQGWRVEMEIL